MRTKFTKSNGATWLAAVALCLAGCTTDLYEPTPAPAPDPTPGPNEKPIWSISPVKDYTLTIRYDTPDNYPIPFKVYTQNPLVISEGGQVTLKNIRPIDAGTTDANGYYSEPVYDVQSTVEALYIYTEAVGVPRLLVAKVNGTALSEATLPDEEPVQTKSSLVLRAGDDYKNATYNQFVDGFNINRLGYWRNGDGYYGRPDYLLAEKVTVSDKVLKTIRARLPEGRTPANIGEILSEGDIHVTKDARIKVHLIDEYTAANSVMGYYCYPTGQRPSKPADIEGSTVVLFPNAKVPRSGAGAYGAVQRGEGVQLHYFKDGKDQGVVFPAGVSVGWIVYNNGYKKAVKGGKVTHNGNNGVASTFYSTPALNGGQKQVALFRIDQFVVLGMEDWKKNKDYNDIVFHVTADPIDAIIDEIPDVDPEDPPLEPSVVNPEGTLAFEDLWPRQGDFDLNDVVVRYKSEITYNERNEVVKTVDDFILLWSGATIHDAFAYQLDALRTDVDITFSGEGAGGAYVDGELSKATVRLFNDALVQTAENTKTTSVRVTTVFRKPYPKSQFRPAPYNPFITTASKDREVHLTNYSPTLTAKPSYFGTEDDRSVYGQGTYYITFDEKGIQMPYAIRIPADPDPEKDIPFVIPRESKRIDQFYPKFLNWVTSGGKQDGDWYLYPIDRPEDPAPETPETPENPTE